MVHFGVHFEVPNRSKNDTENKLILSVFGPPQEIHGPGSGVVIMAPFGPGGEAA